MPTVVIRFSVLDEQSEPTGEVSSVVGFTRGPVNAVFIEDSVLFQENQVPISGLGDTGPPPPVLSAIILGLPLGNQAVESTTVTGLSAELRDEQDETIEFYDPTRWNWAADNGGSFGGPNGDDLTLPAAPATVNITATHVEEDLVANASISVVAALTFSPDFFSLPAQIIQGQQSNPLRSRVVDPDGETAESIQTNWSYAVVSGPGSIGGSSGNNVLIANAGSAGQTITVRATYNGPLNVSPAFDDLTTTAIMQPDPGEFPDHEPAGMTQLTLINGSSKVWPGWTQFGENWNTDRVKVVADSESKYGFAVQKEFRIGDPSGWNSGFQQFPNLLRKELYVRVIFKLSSNWQMHSGGDKPWVIPGSSNMTMTVQGRNIVYGPSRTGFVFPPPLGEVGGAGFFWFPIEPDSPPVPTSGNSLGNLINGGWLKPLSRGEYHTIEYHQRLSDPAPAINGFIKFWIDGVQYTRFHGFGKPTQFRDVSMDPIRQRESGLTAGTQAPMYWGGQSDTKNRNDWVRWSEHYISGKN